MFPTLPGRPTYVSLRWSEENLSAVARSINISLRWSESQLNVALKLTAIRDHRAKAAVLMRSLRVPRLQFQNKKA
jgi:hypothetical protein